ncbi:MAG: S-methyl-5-thioribose-1-phosphate isomerase [Candidatus Marinimicrobia bacterium]|nr:S-methyl-5-thioribose-1-phosphate isomerase [Candidatus Neomarinimicrobiota bacterium]
MKVNGKSFRTIWDEDGKVKIIDQRNLPHEFIIENLNTVDDCVRAIKEMHVRGAGLIGGTAGYGMYFAAQEASDIQEYEKLGKLLIATRPTATNLKWAVDRSIKEVLKDFDNRVPISLIIAKDIVDEDAEFCRMIGEHGAKIIEKISNEKNGEPVNILTHCNAGWLAFVDYGSATAPIYNAFDKGIKVHVWVDETRPRNQGARLTAWELGQHGVPYTIIADNVGGHLMQHSQVDIVIVGTDRTTYTGDVANKVGTYLKALAAKDNNIPFYVALPSSTFDWEIEDGIKQIPIEQRDGDEVHFAHGLYDDKIIDIRLTPLGSNAANFGFDVTPRRLITGLITERGICKASKEGVSELYPEMM